MHVGVRSEHPAKGATIASFDLGACRDPDPAILHPDPDTSDVVARARTVCARCGVRLECLAFALRTKGLDGVWGGLTESERAHCVTADFASMMHRR